MKLSSNTKKKTISFYSYHLNHEKYEQIKNLAKQIQVYQNFISEIYYNTYFQKQKISCSKFITEMKIYRDKDFSSSFFQQICKQVYERYEKKKPPKQRIVFKKLSFVGINLSTKIFIEESKNTYTNGIINFNIPKQGIICIPFRYSKKYHGNLSDITYSMTGANKSQFQKQYTCTLLGKNKLKITIAEDDNRVYSTSINHIEGVDVNVKHNLLQCSDGFSVDYDRKLVRKIIKQRIKYDKIVSTKMKRNISHIMTEKQHQQSLKSTRRSISIVEQCLVKLFKHCNMQNIDHLVFEDLGKFTGHLKITNKEFDINYKRLMYAVRLVDIKNIAERIGKKYGITISLTNPEYTSQECSCCHHISKKNRQTQEHFRCENCGFELNADLNASINIKNRIFSNVLRKSCHQEIEPNKFIPIGIKHEKFKQIYTQMLNDIC